MLYFDGFAGCGELTEGHPGSPIVAIRTAMKAHSGHARLEVRMVEKDPQRCAHLQALIRGERRELVSFAPRIDVMDPVCDECEPVVTALLDQHEVAGKTLGPAFFFLDQYGYSGFSMDLVRRILAHRSCETFSYLNWQRMHPYFGDATKANTLTRNWGR